MELSEFMELVDGHEELEGLGMDAGKQIFWVGHEHSKFKTAVGVDCVGAVNSDAEIKTLISILVGEREPDALYHMTRVVGYYARIGNFNASKLGELKDRLKGNYGFDGRGRTAESVELATAVVNAT